MRTGTKAILYLNDQIAGEVLVQERKHSWTYGTFTPAPQFANFAPLFGRWSLLMHADVGSDRLDEACSEELRRCENELQRLHAKMFSPETGEWVSCAVVTIDAELIEWKVY